MNEQLLPTPKLTQPTATRYIVLLWLCGAAAVAYTQRLCISVAVPGISSDLDLTAGEMGPVLGVFFLCYALAQLPTGWLGDLWGTRKALPLFCLLSSISTAALAASSGFLGLFVGRLVMGVAQAGFLPCATATLVKWFPLRRRSLATGMLSAFMTAGGALGTGLSGLIIARLSWRWMFVVFTLPGLAWSVVFYFWFRDRPGEHRSVNAEELRIIEGDSRSVADGPPEPTPWLRLFASCKMWWLCAQQFCRAAGQAFFYTWFATFVIKAYGVDTQEAGWMTGLMLTSMTVGGLLGGWLSDRLLADTGSRRLSRQWLSVFSQLACVLFVSVGYNMSDAWPAVLLYGAGWLVSVFASPAAFSLTMDMGGKHVGTVFAMMNMAGNLGATAMPWVLPSLIELRGWNETALMMMAGCPLLAAGFWALLDPNGTVFD